MDVVGVLRELRSRIPDEIAAAVDGLSAEQLSWAPSPGANSIGWLVWHLARVQDSHVAELDGEPQAWVVGPWASTFGLEPDADDTGYGHTPAQVSRVRPDGPSVLLDYYAATAARADRFVDALSSDDLDRVVDTRWNPPVTLGVRLVSIVDDCIQHAGQALYVRGLLPA